MRGMALTICVAASLFASAAHAQDDNKWYASANIGFGSLSSSTLTYDDGVSTGSASAEFETSFAGGGTIGYRFDSGFNLEGELMYRRNELDPVDIAGLGSFTEGDFASLGIAVNALYRFNIGDSGKLSGYVGPGYVYFQEIDIDFDNDGQQEISFESDDSAFQFKLGGHYNFDDRWYADVAATYLSAESIRMELPASPAETIRSDYEHWTVSFGVGYRF